VITEADPAQSAHTAAEVQAQTERVGILRRTAAIAVLGAVALLGNLSPAHAADDDTRRDAARGGNHHELTMVVDGDSISAADSDHYDAKYYDNIPGSPHRVWFGPLADKEGIKVIEMTGEGGSGWVQRGNPKPAAPDADKYKGKGTNLMQRLKTPMFRKAFKNADIVLIPLSGLNDTHASAEHFQKVVDATLDELQEIRKGHDPSTVFIANPWPEKAKPGIEKKFAAILEEETVEHGNVFVSMDDSMPQNVLMDHLHPKSGPGGRAMRKAFLHNSQLDQRLAAIRSGIPADIEL
jgi:hypothetical protein